MLYLCTRKQENTDCHNDSVAQLVEHDTLNVGVQGSIPCRVTRVIQFVFLFLRDLVAQLVEHNTFNVGVLGSSPSQVTNILAYVEKLVDLPS